MTITLRFTYAPADASACMRGNARAKASVWLALALFLFFETTIGLSILTGHDLEARPAQIIWYALLLLMPVLLAAFALLSARRGKRAGAGAQETREGCWVIDPEKIVINECGVETTFDWSAFAELVDAGDCLIFRTVPDRGRLAFLSLPKRVFESPSQEAAFRQLCEQKLGASRIKTGSTWGPVLSLRTMWWVTAAGGLAWLAVLIWRVVAR